MPNMRKREARRAANERYERYNWYDEMTHPMTEAHPEHQLYPFTKEQDEMVHRNHLGLLKELATK